jgi:hypothetical protein
MMSWSVCVRPDFRSGHSGELAGELDGMKGHIRYFRCGWLSWMPTWTSSSDEG